jgi:hypothetical protein
LPLYCLCTVTVLHVYDHCITLYCNRTTSVLQLCTAYSANLPISARVAESNSAFLPFCHSACNTASTPVGDGPPSRGSRVLTTIPIIARDRLCHNRWGYLHPRHLFSVGDGAGSIHIQLPAANVGCEMGLAASPARSLRRYTDPGDLSGMGLVPFLSHIFRRYMDGGLDPSPMEFYIGNRGVSETRLARRNRNGLQLPRRELS